MTTLDLNTLYDENYYRNHCGSLAYERSEHFVRFFDRIAERIINDFKPKSMLDAGCAIGMLVESFRERKVQAYGFDISEWAIKQMPTEYEDFVKVGSILDSKSFDRKFDLVTCIEVLEHLQPSEADAAVRSLCSWGDLVIFTSSPDDYVEATHFNVQQPGYWAEKFAQNGFVRMLSYDASYITPWAQVFRRESLVFPSLARQYEDNLWIKTKQLNSQQQSIVKFQQDLDKQSIESKRYKKEFETLAQEIQLREQKLLADASSERKCLQNEIKGLQKSHSELQNDYKSLLKNLQFLQQEHLKLQNNYAGLEKAKSQLNDNYEQISQQLQIANENVENIIRTKAWKAVDIWWKSKHKVVSWLPQKQARLNALYNTSKFIWQNHGSAALANQSFRFLKGERNNIILTSSNGHSTTEFAPPIEIQNVESVYDQWIRLNEPDRQILNRQRKNELDFEYRPLISVLTPVYNTSEAVLRKMIESVLEQTYSNWELCLVDGCSPKAEVRSVLEEYERKDSRIKVKFLAINAGISGNTNEALHMATGEFIALLDHDDELAPNAIYENVLLLNQNPDADIIYSDEDKLNAENSRCDAFFKPDWSPDLLRSIMYTCHLGVYRTSLVKSVGEFRSGFDGSQDHDLMLRLIEKTARIHHIPKVLYHWRMTPGSTALNAGAKDYAEAARIKAVQEHCERLGLKGITQPGLFNGAVRLRYLPENNPLVSIIIPTRDRLDILRQCINSILKLSTYENYEILVINNNSSKQETLDYFDLLKKQVRTRVLEYSDKFNFSAINNFAAAQANGELLLFLNNDTEVISMDWLESMIEHALRPEVGAVGARLMYPNNTIQHAGVIVGMGGVAGHAHIDLPFDSAGYFGRVQLIQNFSAVTGACLMTRAEIFKEFNGFNEQDLAVAFNDVDFCLRLRERNLLIVYTPYAELYHHESLSRGSDLSPENIERFKREIEYMENNWREVIDSDPYYNPNLSLDLSHGTFVLAPISRNSDSLIVGKQAV